MMYISLISFVCMVSFYCVAFIRTDLVTIHETVIIESYQQILADHRLKPKWMSQESEYQVFEEAKQGSVKHKLWLRSQPDPKVTLMKDNSMIDLLTKLHESAVVVIGNYVTMRILKDVMCPIARSSDYRPLITRHATEEEHEEIRSSMYNDRVEARIIKVLESRMRSFSESGIMQHLHSLTGPPYVLGDPADIRICRHNRPSVGGERDFLQKTFEDYTSLF